ncbi:MAG TPA: hypothetical protein VGX37_12115, partial [Allosphingosinicella sp.]|nr:hypothetical protein [Allosphingosinicella sp.]
MITSRSDDLLVGFVSLLLLPLIAWRIFRGLRDGSLPLYRTYVDRTGGSRFGVLLALHVLSF